MAGDSYETIFEYEGKQIPLKVMVYWKSEDREAYYLFINKFLDGIVTKEGNYWRYLFKPDETDNNKHNTVFDLQAHDLQIIGEIIEENLS